MFTVGVAFFTSVAAAVAAALKFNVAANSQYIALISVGGM